MAKFINGILFRSYETETVSAKKTLIVTSPHVQFLEADVSSQDIVLPAESSCAGLIYYIVNTGSTYNLVVKEDSEATTLQTIEPGATSTFFCDGTNWGVHSGSYGTSGISGESGTSGILGTSGISGISGISGFSGTKGDQGASGTSGIGGTSGILGTTGNAGSTGASGASGISGTSGATGASGTSGEIGTSGISGKSGEKGTSGTSGARGTSGISGKSGERGTTGTSGASGAVGISGKSGAKGTTGTSGASGAVGISGKSGAKGNTGTTGTSGILGYVQNTNVKRDLSGDVVFRSFSTPFGVFPYAFLATPILNQVTSFVPDVKSNENQVTKTGNKLNFLHIGGGIARFSLYAPGATPITSTPFVSSMFFKARFTISTKNGAATTNQIWSSVSSNIGFTGSTGGIMHWAIVPVFPEQTRTCDKVIARAKVYASLNAIFGTPGPYTFTRITAGWWTNSIKKNAITVVR